MSYLSFDKTLLINLEKSLSKEMIRTNRAGAYNSSTLIDCNTRKYHGQLVIPIPEIDDDNHVMLSSFDETVIQRGAAFNLGIHKYEGNNFSPNGHKYIREFECENISRTIYRVGGVVLSKEKLVVSFEPRLLIKYTLLEAHSPTTLQFRPYLGFRNVNHLSYENETADTSYKEDKNGVSVCLYPQYPCLHMQFSKKNQYVHNPHWNKHIEYYKEQERGYDFKEDLVVPGHFELAIKKGESIIFSAGISSISPTQLKKLWDSELERRNRRLDMFSTLKNSAQQFYKRTKDNTYILAGYPWFKARARDQFVALPGCTLAIDRLDYFEDIMKTSVGEIYNLLQGNSQDNKLEGLDDSEALLYFIWVVQKYAEFVSLDLAVEKYGSVCIDIIDFVRNQKHPKLVLHNNGLLHVDGTSTPVTWMNAVENGFPITPRTGYVVEINSLWYNSLKFTSVILGKLDQTHSSEMMNYQAEIAKDSFVEVFWNGDYLYDYVVNGYKDKEVRPNMLHAVAHDFSPLSTQQQKSVLDICTRELLTPKGLRSLSPQSGYYRPNYVGGMLERNRNYHNGPVWPSLFGTFAKAYLKIYKQSGVSFIERMLLGLEAEMTELCVGTLPELFDGNPPYKGHGGMSFATSVAETLRILYHLNKIKTEQV